MMTKSAAMLKVVVSLVAVGSLSIGGISMAGAAQQHGGQSQDGAAQTDQRSESQMSAETQTGCMVSTRHLTFSQHRQSRFAAKTKAFVALEAKAEQAGHTKLAAYWAKVVARRTGYSTRMHAKLQSRMAGSTGNEKMSGSGCTQSDSGSDSGSNTGSDSGSNSGSNTGSDSGSNTESSGRRTT